MGAWVVYYGYNPFIPTTQKVTIPIELIYPPISNGPLENMSLKIDFNLEAKSTFAVGVNITIADINVKTYGETIPNATNEYLSNSTYFNSIIIGFWNTNYLSSTMASLGSGNSSYQITSFDPTTGIITEANQTNQYTWDLPTVQGVWLLATGPNNNLTPILNAGVVFGVSGEYSPSIILGQTTIFNNSTYHSSTSIISAYTYNQIQIPILSTQQLNSDELENIGGILTIAIFVLADIEALKLTWEFQKVENDPKKEAITDFDCYY
jgi:hypothetical protein